MACWSRRSADWRRFSSSSSLTHRGTGANGVLPPSLRSSHALQLDRQLRPFSLASKEQKISLWYPVLGGLAITVAGGLHYLHDHMGGTEGLWRSLSFYSLAVPKYVVYRYHSWRQSPDHVWEQLDRETSQQGLVKILELEGFYIKCGQLCASNLGDAFPEIWQDTMSVLQDQVPPQPFSVIKSIVASELDFDKVFSSFEETPIGSASIGQVHRAVLADGRRVVVKVCYPNVERLLKGDVRTIKLFAQLAQPVHVPALEETEKQFQTEFDYRKEARNLAIVRENLTKAGLVGPGKLCQVPMPYEEYCTKRVLVMEELSGDKLPAELRRDVEQNAARAGQSVNDFLASQKSQEQAAEDRGVRLQGPSQREYDLFISLADGKRRLANTVNRLHNLTIGWLPGTRKREIQNKSVLPLNHAKLVDDLLLIHGHEVLIDGFFQGDPHPGNFLLCRTADGSPQIGLIDYGQVKTLSKQDRHLFARILIALDDGNRDEIVRLMKEAGYKSKYMDPENIYLYAKVGYDQDNAELTGGKHIQMFMEDLQAKDPIIELPKEFLMVSRSSLMLRGLAHALHQSRSVAKTWRPLAERVLREDI